MPSANLNQKFATIYIHVCIFVWISCYFYNLEIEAEEIFSFRDISLYFDQSCCAFGKAYWQTSGCQNVYLLWWQMQHKTNNKIMT